MLEKIVTVDRVDALENGSLQVRTKIVIMEDGTQASATYHRHVVAPGDDYSTEDAKVQVIAAAVHTSEVIAAYKAAQALAQQDQIPA